MAIQHQTTVKSWFESGDRPTQAQFADWIETSMPNWFVDVASAVEAGSTGAIIVASTVAATIGGLGPLGAGVVGGQIFRSGVTASVASLFNAGAFGSQMLTTITTASAASMLATTVAVSASAVTFQHVEPGGIVRTGYSKWADFLSIKDFGATGDGVTDDRASIVAAISAMPAGGGGLYFPTGIYKISAPVTVHRPGFYWGDGEGTIIQTGYAVGTGLHISSTFVHLDNMKFNSSLTRTAGSYIHIGASRTDISNFHMDNAYVGISVPTSAQIGDITIIDGRILSTVASGGGIRLGGNVVATKIKNLLMDSTPNASYGILCDGAIADLTIMDCQLLHTDVALYLNANGGNCETVWASQTFFDNSGARGVFLNAVNSGIYKCRFDGCWFSSSLETGVLAQTVGIGNINGVDFNGCFFFLNTNNGYRALTSAITNISFNNCQAAGNGGAGISIAQGNSNYRIIGNRLGATSNVGGNAYGIFADADLAGSIIMCNDLRNNTSAPVNGLTTANVVMFTANIYA